MNNHKNFGGKTMSLTKRAALRLSLLAGSSLVAASLTTVAVGLVVVPAPALAAAACTPAPSSGAGTNSVAYDGAAYAGGITCSSGGAMTVSVTASSPDIGSTGIRLSGNGADSVTFNGPASAEIDGVGLTGALVDITSGSGDITAITNALDADQSTATAMTHGLRALSTSGDIDLTVTGIVDADASGANSGGVAGIYAVTGGTGEIAISATSVQGRLYGIYAETTGGGDISITSTASGIAHSTAGLAGIYARTSGNLTVSGGGAANSGIGVDLAAGGDVTYSGTGTATSAGGVGVRIDADGDILFTGTGRGGAYGIDLIPRSGTTNVVTLTGDTNGGTAALRAQGGGAVDVNVLGRLGGNNGTVNTGFDLSGLTQAASVTFQDGSVWRLGSVPITMAGPDSGLTLTIEAGSTLIASLQLDAPIFNIDATPQNIEPVTLVTFSGDNDILSNAGDILVGGRSPSAYLGTDINFANAFLTDRHEAELRFEDLEEFHHSGLILLGGYYLERTDRGTDGWYDDILSMPGAHWVGDGGEIVFDVDLAGPAQTDCVRDADGNLTSADCLMLVGGSTEGVTYVTVAPVVAGDRGAYNPDGFLLVDVSGGVSHQGDFVVGPNTVGYSALQGGMMDKGYFAYLIAYNDDTQQHRLVSVPSGNALQTPGLAHAAQSLWRTTAGSWLDRRSDARAAAGEEFGGRTWLKVAGEHTQRDLMQTVQGGGQTFTFDNSSSQTSYAVTGGLDLIVGEADGSYVAGVTAGYSHADVKYDASPNTAVLDGFSAGVYASYVSSGLYLDGIVNANKAILRWDAPGFNFADPETILDTDLLSLGIELEGGWRIPWQEHLYIEPLASISYVSTKIDDLYAAPDDSSRDGVAVQFEDAESLRLGIGARLGLDYANNLGNWGMTLLGRYWNETEGENAILIQNPGPSAPVADVMDGGFGEFGVGVNLQTPNDNLSGFFRFGGMFGRDYQSESGTVGVRVSW